MQKCKFVEIASTSLLWRILFLLGLLFIPTWIMVSYPYKSIPSILKLLLFEGLINSLFIYGVIILVKKTNEINGKTVIERCIEGMYNACSKIVVIGGYNIEKLAPVLDKYSKVNLVYNENYQLGIYSLMKALLKYENNFKY